MRTDVAQPDRGAWRQRTVVASSIGLAAALLAWTLRDVSLPTIAREIGRANPWWLLVSCVLATATIPVRAARWREILEAGGAPVRWVDVWRATAAGYMANNLLPARSGEVARGFLARSLIGVPLATALTSIALERILDGVVVVGLLLLAIAFPGHSTGSSAVLERVSGAAWIAALVFAGALGAAFAATRAGPAEWGRLLAFVPGRLRGRIADFRTRARAGTAALVLPAVAARLAAWSLALWTVNAAAFYTAFLAFRLGPLPPVSAFLVQGIVALGLAAPSAPGFFGSFEAFSRIGLSIYGVPAARAVSFAVGTHIGWFLPVTALGLWELARTRLTWRDLKRPLPPPQDAQVSASPSSNETVGT